MKYKDIPEEYLTETSTVLVESNNKQYALSDLNTVGGGCDCCFALGTNMDDLDVIRVVDMATMEVLYQK